MFDTFTMTQTLSMFLGLYLLCIGVGMVMERDQMQAMVKQYSDNVALGYMGGIIAFVIGAILVGLHQNFSTTHGIVVSLLGWVILAKGALILSFRGLFMRLTSSLFISPKVAMGFGLVALLAGLWMMSAI